MDTIAVHHSRGSYPVYVGRGTLEMLPEVVSSLGASRVAVIADRTVADLHLSRVMSLLPVPSYAVDFPAGESSKTMSTALHLLEFLAENHFTRADLVVALGGGVTGDLAGFAAALYQRGIRVVQIPTTFLAAVDSSVGGKTGVDLPQGKNLAGAFWQPSAVLCDTALLDTLPRRILHDGMAEAVKYAVIRDAGLWKELECGEDIREKLPAIIARCVRIKAEIVAEDEFDMGKRALLNFGHTIGHAVEQCSGFTISHGQAVGMGMVRMTRLAEAQGWSPEGLSEEIASLLRRYELPTEVPFPWKELTAAMLHDKKRSGDSLKIVVPERLGYGVCRVVSAEWLAQAGI